MLLAYCLQYSFRGTKRSWQRAANIGQRKTGAANHDEFDFRQELHRLLPGANVLESIHADQEIQLVTLLQPALKTAHCFDRIIGLAGVRVEKRRHKTRIVGRGQGQHSKAMLEVGEPALLLVRRQISRSKVHAPQIKFLRRSPGHRHVAKMHRIKGAAKKTYLHSLSALPLLEGSALGNALHALSFLFSFATGNRS